VAACATLSVEQERDLGEEMSRQVQAELVFLRDPVVVHYIEDIGERIVRASGPQNFDYRFYVVDDDQINAFAMPAGHVYVNTETILKARNVSELAGVMAHEVGHVVERHIAENYNRQRTAGLLQQFGVVAAGVTLGQAGAGAANILGGLSAMAVINSFGRDAEREADAFAVEVMPEAGFHPGGIVTFFETLRAEGGAGAPSFLSSHPATEERIANTSSLIRARDLPPGLRHEDGGRLEIIQRRIRLLTGRTDPEER
jgi:predicted Zn-dependent protease